MPITGTAASETLKGTAGADQIDGMGGSDTILARGGDDTIDFTVAGGVSRVNGGAGTDTTAFHSAAIEQDYYLSEIAQVENLSFVGNAGEYNVATIGYVVPFAATEQVTPAFPTQISGGDSYDYIAFSITGGMGDVDRINVPDITFTNWHTYPASYANGPADSFTIQVDDNADYTFYASDFIGKQGVQQDFQLGDGNDTVYGSSGAEFMSGHGGINKLYGLGGNDTFKLSIRYPLLLESIYDGGSGTDFLSIYGNITFAGTATSIEGINFFSGQFVAPTGAIKLSPLYAANFTMTATQIATLAPNLQFAGFGNLHVTDAATFSAARYQFLDGARVTIEVTGTAANNVLTGSSVNDTLSGLAGTDKLLGGSGNDTLMGGAGNDTLTGGAGADHFVFNTTPDTATNRDTIVDFDSAQADSIDLSAAVFAGFGHTGALTTDEYYASAGAKTAHDASDRIIYNTTTGMLYYDADGSGGTAAIALALFKGMPPLAAADFSIIA